VSYPIGCRVRVPALAGRTGVIFEELKGDAAGANTAAVKFQIRLDDTGADAILDWNQIILLDQVPPPHEGNADA
jgi:hypothetical protein